MHKQLNQYTNKTLNKTTTANTSNKRIQQKHPTNTTITQTKQNSNYTIYHNQSIIQLKQLINKLKPKTSNHE